MRICFRFQSALSLQLDFNVSQTYLSRTSSVPAPYLWAWTCYGAATDLTRSSYGLYTELVRTSYGVDTFGRQRYKKLCYEDTNN